MAKGTLNRVTLIGNVGRDVEFSAKGPVAKINLATTEVTKDKEERTEWHTVTLFGKIADLANNYVTKGSKILIEGRLHLNKWTDKEGKQRYSTDIIANSMQLLGGPRVGPNKTPSSDAPAPTEAAPPWDGGDIPF